MLSDDLFTALIYNREHHVCHVTEPQSVPCCPYNTYWRKNSLIFWLRNKLQLWSLHQQIAVALPHNNRDVKLKLLQFLCCIEKSLKELIFLPSPVFSVPSNNLLLWLCTMSHKQKRKNYTSVHASYILKFYTLRAYFIMTCYLQDFQLQRLCSTKWDRKTNVNGEQVRIWNETIMTNFMVLPMERKRKLWKTSGRASW
jgi:hypothetical protein